MTHTQQLGTEFIIFVYIRSVPACHSTASPTEVTHCNSNHTVASDELCRTLCLCCVLACFCHNVCLCVCFACLSCHHPHSPSSSTPQSVVMWSHCRCGSRHWQAQPKQREGHVCVTCVCVRCVCVQCAACCVQKQGVWWVECTVQPVLPRQQGVRVPVPVVWGRWCGLRRMQTLRKASRKSTGSTCCLRPQQTCQPGMGLTQTFAMVDWTAAGGMCDCRLPVCSCPTVTQGQDLCCVLNLFPWGHSSGWSKAH